MSSIQLLNTLFIPWFSSIRRGSFDILTGHYMKQWKKYILAYFWCSLLVAQIVLVFVFGMVNEAGINVLLYVGWIIWLFSVILGWLPIFTLKRKGGVAKGKSYVHTTVLVDRGLYAIVRHPQYTAGILFSLALIFISQSWLIATFGFVAILLQYLDILKTEKYEIKKFGQEYIHYMKKVPRVNFLLGFIRILRSSKSKNN